MVEGGLYRATTISGVSSCVGDIALQKAVQRERRYSEVDLCWCASDCSVRIMYVTLAYRR